MNKKTVSTTKKVPKAFLVAIIFAMLFWFLIKMTKEYSSTIKLPVSYINVSQSNILEATPVKEIKLNVRATGFKLLTASIQKKEIKLDVTTALRKSKNNYYILPNNQRSVIQRQLLSGVLLDRVEQDTINIRLGYLTVKKVPIIPNVKISYQLGYDAVDVYKVSPDSVVVSGTETQMRDLNNVSTELIDLENVSTNIQRELVIKLPEGNSNLKTNITKTNLSIDVDKFTEGSFEIPVTITNLPNTVQINTFPKNVKVLYKVALSHYKQVPREAFSVLCDYKQAAESNTTYFTPKVVTTSPFVKSVRIVPEKVEFLIQK